MFLQTSHILRRDFKKKKKVLFISEREKLCGLDGNIQESQGVKEKNVHHFFVYHMFNVT